MKQYSIFTLTVLVLIMLPVLNVHCKDKPKAPKLKIGYIADITFPVEITREDGTAYIEGNFPCINLDRYEESLSKVENPDEIVLEETSVCLILESPLLRSQEVNLTTENKGFSRIELLKAIGSNYKRLYDEEVSEASLDRVTKLDQYTIYKLEVYRDFGHRVNIIPFLVK